jgi:quercetin dioxygenase-like cupin family protein
MIGKRAPAIQANMVDGVFVRQMYFFETGSVLQGHTHSHNHITLLAAGKLRVTVNGESTEFTAPHMIFIHKDHEHALEALADKTVAYCVHAVRDQDTGEILDGLGVPQGVQLEGLLGIDVQNNGA